MLRDPLPGSAPPAGLAGSADALALCRLAARAAPLAVVSATARDAQRLVEEMAWFAPQLRVCLCPPSYLAARTFFLEQNTRLDAAALKAQLATAGYRHVTQVMAPGEFCIRGGLIDLFPTGSQVPYRLDLD